MMLQCGAKGLRHIHPKVFSIPFTGSISFLLGMEPYPYGAFVSAEFILTACLLVRATSSLLQTQD